MTLSRPLRILLGVIVALVILFVVAMLALPSLVNVNQYHDKIQAELQKALDRNVTIGNLQLKTFPVRVRVENVNIAEDPNFQTGRPFATANEVDISVKLLPLLSKNVEINSIELLQPKIELVRNAQGVWNYSSIGGNAQPAEKKPSSSNQQLSVSDLRLTDGSVAVTDLYQPPSSVKAGKQTAAAAKPGRSVYDHIDLGVRNFAPDKNFEVNLTAHLPGQGNQSIALAGNAGPINQTNSAATPVDAKLTLNAVQIGALQQFLQSDALKGTEGVANGDVALKNENGNFAANGDLKLDQGKLHGVELGYPVSANFDVKGDMNSEAYQINKMDVKLGPTPIEATGSVNAKANPMIADIHVKANDASLSELARLASAFGVAFAPGTNVAGKLNADVTAKGAMDAPALSGSLNLNDVRVSGAQIKQPVDVKAIQIAMSPASLHANPFTITSGGAAVNVEFTLNNYTDAKARSVDASLKANQTDLADLLSIAHAYGVSAADGMSGTGQIALDAHVTGPLANTAALNFSGTGALRNASITTPQLAKPVNIRNADLRFSQNTATVQNLNMNVGSTNATGQLAVSNFAAPNLQFTFNADKLNVPELQALMKPAPATAPKPAEKTTGPSHSPLENVTGGGQVAVGQILYQNVVLNNTKATVTLNHGIVKLAPVTTELFNGTENGTITVDTRPAQSVVAVNATLKGVDANKLLTAFSSVRQVYGALNANTNISFVNVANGNPAATLNGTLNMNLQNGKITGIDLLRELGSIAKFGGGGSGATNITQLSGAFNIRNGLAHTDNLKAAIDGGTLGGIGDVNLASQELNMKVTAVLNSALSKQVGGTSVGGYMNTALANNQGELVIPAIVTGTFSSPHFQPDVQQLAEMKLKNLLPTTGNPAGMLSGVLGGGGNGAKGGGLSGVLGALGGKQQQQNPNQQQQQQQQKPNAQDEVKGLLDQFGKKPK